MDKADSTQLVQYDNTFDLGLFVFRCDALRKVSWMYVFWLVIALMLMLVAYYTKQNQIRRNCRPFLC